MSSAISVVVPLYNCETYVIDCLESIVAELNDRDELIVVDDGSVDDSAALVEHYFEHFLAPNKIGKLIRKSNGGVSSARNAGIDVADRDWCMFVDADDLLSAGWRESIEHSILQFPDASLIFMSSQANPGYSTDTVTAVDGILGIASGENLQAKGMASVWSKLYRLSENNTENIRFHESIIHGEDALFNIEYVVLAQRWAFAKADFYRYRISSGSATHSYSSKFLDSNIIFIDEMARIVRDGCFSAEKQVEYRNHCFIGSVFIFVKKLAQTGNNEIISSGANEFYKNQVYARLLKVCAPTGHESALELFTWHVSRLGGLAPLSALYGVALRNKKKQEEWMSL